MVTNGNGVEVRQVSGVSFIKFTQPKILDAVQIAEIEEEIIKSLNASERGDAVISFRHVELLSSAALGMLLKVKGQVESKKGRLKLSEINERILEIFKITGLNKVFEIHKTGDKALKSF